MLLCDAVGSLPPILPPDDGAVRTALPVDRRMAQRVREAPIRFVLSDAVYETSLFAAIEQPDCLSAALRTLRVPHPLMWIEWTEARGAHSGARSRAGVLVESSDEGRSGRLTSAWMDNDDGPYRGPSHFRFDLDSPISTGLASFDIDRNDTSFYEHYDSLFRHVALEIQKPWLSHLEARARGPLRGFLTQLFAASAHDFPIICAFLLLLAQPKALAPREISMEKLNRSRAKKGRHALLDHVELHMRLDSPGHKLAGAGDGLRDSARLHWVRGHLVNRSSKIFWRRSHVRGDASRGEVLKRTVHVDGAAPMRSAAE